MHTTSPHANDSVAASIAATGSPYAKRRRHLLEQLAARGTAALVFTASLKTRNSDSEYRYRPDSDFWWLTGFDESDSVLVLLPGRRAGASVLFVRTRVPAEEVWTGRRLGVERAVEVLDVDEARPMERLWDELPGLLAGYERILYRTGLDEARDRHILALGVRLRQGARGAVAAPREWVDPMDTLHELRLIKDPHEVAIMRRAAAISVEAHAACMAAAAPQMHEYEIDALLEYTFRRRGCTGAAYTNIVAGGSNACILHYSRNAAPLRDGDLLLIDAGAEVEYYASDVTRTFPINGRFSAEQRALYAVVLEAQVRAIEHTAPGATLESVHAVATRVLVEGLLDLGLLTGSVDGVIESKAYRRFTLHGTGHWLGLDVHDVGLYHGPRGAPRLLAPGMVTTVEPGLYVGADEPDVDPRWRGIGIRIEDDVLITASGNDVLTAALPKTISAVEEAWAARGNPG